MAKPTGDEVAAHYVAGHDRLLALARTLTTEQLASAVPSTPGWDVHGVIAHVVGIASDSVAGRITGLPSDEFTAAQVAQRCDHSIEDLAAEWVEALPALTEAARAGYAPANLAVDVITHEQDIRGALGLRRLDDPAAVRFSVDIYSWGCRYRVRSAELPELRLSASDSDFELDTGDGAPAASLTAPEYELFRVLSGRRNAAQVCSLQWSGDPAPYLDHLNVFGPLPTGDITD